jgi:hypothetical protein
MAVLAWDKVVWCGQHDCGVHQHRWVRGGREVEWGVAAYAGCRDAV